MSILSLNHPFFSRLICRRICSAEEMAAAAAAAAVRNAIASPLKSDKKDKAAPPSSASKSNPSSAAEDASDSSASASAAASAAASLDLTAWIVWALRAEHQRVPMLKALMMHHVHQLLPLMLDAIYASYVAFPEAPLSRVDAVVPGSQGADAAGSAAGSASGSGSTAASGSAAASSAGSGSAGTRLWPAVWAAVTRPVDRRHAADLYLHVILAQLVRGNAPSAAALADGFGVPAASGGRASALALSRLAPAARLPIVVSPSILEALHPHLPALVWVAVCVCVCGRGRGWGWGGWVGGLSCVDGCVSVWSQLPSLYLHSFLFLFVSYVCVSWTNCLLAILAMHSYLVFSLSLFVFFVPLRSFSPSDCVCQPLFLFSIPRRPAPGASRGRAPQSPVGANLLVLVVDAQPPDAVLRARGAATELQHAGAVGSLPRGVARHRSGHAAPPGGRDQVLDGSGRTDISAFFFGLGKFAQSVKPSSFKRGSGPREMPGQ